MKALTRLCAGLATLSLAFGPNAAQAAGPSDLCEPIIQHLRRGEAHRSSGDTVLAALGKSGGLKLGETRMIGADELRRLKPTAALEARFPRAGELVTLSWLEPGRVGMIDDVQGTLRCSNLTFFRVEQGRARRIAPPRSLRVRGTHLCWTNGVRTGSVEGRPALLEEDSEGAPWTVELQVFPWIGDAWGKPCRLQARFAAELVMDTRHCTAGAVCGDLESEALRLARRREHHQPMAPADPRFATLAAKSTALEELPAQDGTIAYGHFADPQLTTPRTGGADTVAVVGGGDIGWREYPGHIVAFWRETADGGLTPLAGYQIARRRGALTSVRRLP